MHHLIPSTIVDLLKFQYIKICLVLTGDAAQGRWPCVRINMNQQCVDDFAVTGTQQVEYEFTVEQQSCELEIVYYNKTDQDTVVNRQGEILENQSVTVNEITINGVDLVRTNLIFRDIGCYTMLLSDPKKQYFLDHDINTGPSHSLGMFENGTWAIRLGVPVLSFLSQKQQHTELAEQQDTQPILEEIYQKILVCKALTQ